MNYDYLMEGRLKEDLFYVEFGDSNIDEITLCYINEDNKSELYVYTDMEYALYTDYDGRVIELLRGHGVGGDVKWWERGNRILQLWYESRGTIYSDDIRVYEITNGELHQIGKGNLVSSLTLAKTKGHPLATWNDIEVTEDKYYVLGSRHLMRKVSMKINIVLTLSTQMAGT